MEELTLLLILLLVKYSCDPSFKIEKLIQYPSQFESIFLMSPSTFFTDIVAHCIPNITYPKSTNLSHQPPSFKQIQPCQLSAIDRIARGVLRTRDCPIPILCKIYDQSPSTTYSDIIWAAETMVSCLAPIYASPIIPFSCEYYQLLSGGLFSFFKRTLYAYDICKVCIYLILQILS